MTTAPDTAAPVRTDTLSLIGNTPLVLLKGPSEAAGCEIWGKCEFANPGASVKDRAALWIVRDAEARGELKPGGTVIEGTAGNTGIGIDRWEYDARAAARRPSLLERAWTFDLCAVLNIAAALALREFLRQRGARLRLPSGACVGAEAIRLVQGAPPPPRRGLSLGFHYTCAARNIGYPEPRLMGSSHLWIEVGGAEAEESPHRGGGGGGGEAAAAAAVYVDFASSQFGLGDPVDIRAWMREPPSQQQQQPQQQPHQTRARPARHVYAPAASGAMRAWALVETAGAASGVLRPPDWRADAPTMAALDAAAATSCGVEGCARRGCGGAWRNADGDDQIAALIHTAAAGYPADTRKKGPHACRTFRTALLATLHARARTGT